MILIEPTNPRNIRFSSIFENEIDNEFTRTNSIDDVFRNVAWSFAQRSGAILQDIEIDLARDLYLGKNPWRNTTKVGKYSTE